MSTIDYEDNAEELVDSLPTYYPKEEEGSNYKFLKVIANRIDQSEIHIEDLDNAVTVQNADTIEQLEKLAAKVNLKSREGESKEEFRARVISAHQLLTSEGTPKDLIVSTAEIVNSVPEKVIYEEYTGDLSDLVIGISASDLSAVELTNEQVAKEVEKLIPAGYTLTAFVRGTFEVANKLVHEDDLHDESKAVSGLDENGDPIEGRGTISTTIN